MGIKRKPKDAQVDPQIRPVKKVRQERENTKQSTFLCPAQPDWHAVALPPLPTRAVTRAPAPSTVDALQQYATELLTAENAAYNENHLSGSSQHKFLSTIMSSGTLEDKISALTLLVQESPLHTMKAFDNLLALGRKKSRNQALMAVAALKDLLGQGVVLPGDRKLRSFGKQPGLLAALQSKSASWSAGQKLPSGLETIHLVVWAFEDWLKKKYFELLQILETWCNDEVEYARSRAITYVWELLKEKPEQEENLLRLLVNKLGDTDKKIASRASHLLLQLEVTHPAMKLVITNSVEADCLFRPGQNMHAQYYAVITLNQTVLSQKEEELANRLLEIYFNLFVQLLKSAKQRLDPVREAKEKAQGGGGVPGKAAQKKRLAEERVAEAELQMRERTIAAVLSGVNRAFPYADTSDPTFEKQLDTVFRVAHSTNFNTSIQALILLQQISSRKHVGADRFYKTLYASLLDPRLVTSSKQVLYLNLLYKSLKADINAKRVQAFVKRLLQTIAMHEPPFACGVLFLISELQKSFGSVRTMLTDPEVGDEDEEERFIDAREDGQATQEGVSLTPTNSRKYDPRKLAPEFAHADQTCLWDVLPLLQHYHPSVTLFAEAVYGTKHMPEKPDPTQHTLMHFLDRFIYRNPKAKAAVTHGSSIMQPMGGSSAADLLVKPGDSVAKGLPVNSESFWAKRIEDVAPDEVFFHSYFNASNKKRKTADKTDKKKLSRGAGDDDSDVDEDAGEDEIWQAIANSRPEVEGPDDDDDLSMGDLESAYGDSEDESEAGIDLGGDGDGDDDGLAALLAGDDKIDDGDDVADADDDDGDMEDFPQLDSDDEGAFLDDEDEVPVALDGDEEGAGDEEKPLSRSQQKRKEKRKLKQLPTFASAEDYAKLLEGEDDGM